MLILTILCSCSLADSDIAKKKWKHSHGLHIGDMLDFENSTLSVTNDSILENGKLVGLILEASYRTNGDQIMLIVDPTGDKIGRYVGK